MVVKQSNYVYNVNMDLETTATRLAELGNPTRLHIFRYLVKVGPNGSPVGQIQKAMGIPGSTLSHHIRRLVSVGLIRQERQSRILYCYPQFDVLEAVIRYLLSECCTGEKCGIIIRE